MDLENQARIKDLYDKYGKEDLIVVLGGAEAEASGLAAETVATGDPTFAGPYLESRWDSRRIISLN
jgi:glycine reductase